MLPHRTLEERLRAVVAVVVPEADLSVVQVRPCPNPKFGDLQTNALMALAKAARRNPRELAAEVKERLEAADVCEAVDIAGPGFLNFKLRDEALGDSLAAAARGEHGFFHTAARPETLVVDFSSPNVAKPMHVGHIRSTILGDCLARVLRLLGHAVVTDNHIGDWGTQFGMLLHGWKHELDEAALERDAVAELERLYKGVQQACKKDETVLESARAELVKLQQGDEVNRGIWERMIDLSREQFDSIYGRLGVTFDHTLGESFYNDRLQAVTDALQTAGIARESDGALCVFSDDAQPREKDPFYIQKDGEWQALPCMVRKADGAANYATTDLATLDYRQATWHPARIIYVTDGRQQLHFRQVFSVFRRWKPECAVSLEHVWFGTILGGDGKPFKTRSGETVRLSALLDEAEERAFGVVTERSPDLPEAERREIARIVGLGSVKYADLLPNRQSDYVFDWDKMLALNGNTAVYLLYACTRILSLFRKAGESPGMPERIRLDHPAERALALQLQLYDLVLQAVAAECRPNYLCNYLYELAGLFAGFYENCPVLKAEGEMRAHRLWLCELTGRVLRQGLGLLGIETPDRM